ncbi:hypothetical protein M9458_057420, partial [Cirrhinus mrigala]
DFAKHRSSSGIQIDFGDLSPSQCTRGSPTATRSSHNPYGGDGCSSSTPPVASPRLAYPDKFDGTPAKCKGFHLQCSLFVTQQPALYPTEESRIAFVCSLLTGKALDWATAVWDLNRPTFPSFETFLRRFKEVFDYPEGGDSARERILTLRQGKTTAAEFALTFRTLAAQTSWPDDPLKLHFRKGLSHDLQAELACRDEGKTLDELINLAIRIDNLIRSRKSSKDTPPQLSIPPSTPEEQNEAMQVAHTRLTAEERDRRQQLNLCLYCGKPGHIKISCPSRPMQCTSSAVSHYSNSSHTVKAPVNIVFLDKQINTTALIDSGAAGNFMDLDFAKAQGLSLIPCTSPLSVAALDGRPLGPGRVHYTTSDLHLTTGALHTETIRFFLIQAPCNPVILGLPWLQQHEPLISWMEGQITQWSDRCFAQCFPTLKPRVLEVASVKVDSPIPDNIPPEYHDLTEAFSKIFPLSQPETDTMKAYIEEEVAKGFIVPSTSAASAGFFFVKKKDGSLRPCIDFRGLNDITVKYRYPLPLMPPALEQLRSARRFIRNFSSIAAPLTSMVKKGSNRLSWPLAAIKAFELLKKRFTTAPILHHPDPEHEFVVEIDASNTGIGAVLSQRHGNPPKLFPCAFYSRKLTQAEQNYDVGNRELLAMKAALEEWRHWLEGTKLPFTILTDHRNLEYLRSAKRLNHRQARWALFFTRFDFTVTYRPGSKNTKADALSRQFEADYQPLSPDPILPPTLIVAPIQWDIMTELTEMQDTNPPPADCPPDKVHVPQPLRKRVLQLVHNDPCSGHPGISATLQLLSNKFWWPSIRSDTINFIKNCEVCCSTKSSKQLPAGLLQPLPIPQRPWSHIAIDFVTDLPPSERHTTILTVVDRFSKSCRLIPLPKLPSALETAETLCNYVFRFYGLPDDIVSDRGPQFTSRLWSAFFKCLNVN